MIHFVGKIHLKEEKDSIYTESIFKESFILRIISKRIQEKPI